MASNTDRAVADMARLARRLRIDEWIYPTAAIVAFVVLWDFSVRIFDVKTVVLPSPGQVYDSLIGEWGNLAPHLWFTIYEILAGFALSVVIGIGIAIAIVTWRPIEKSIYPILVGSQVVPKIALAPLFVIWFGFGIEPKILIAFLIAFFPRRHLDGRRTSIGGS